MQINAAVILMRFGIELQGGLLVCIVPSEHYVIITSRSTLVVEPESRTRGPQLVSRRSCGTLRAIALAPHSFIVRGLQINVLTL